MKFGLRKTWLVVLGVIAYVVFLLISMPATQAWAWFGEQAPVKVYGISGTIWQGQAALLVQQDQRLEALQWEVRPAGLLRGQLRAQVQARVADGRLRGNVAVTPSGRFEAQQLRLDMPATDLVQWAGLSLPVQVEGRLDTLLQDLAVDGPRVVRADGLISWHDASIRFGASALPLGNLALRLEPGSEGDTGGLLTSQGGPIDIQGRLNMSPNGAFVMDLDVQVVGEVADEVLPSMKLLGIPEDGRQVHARLSGNLDGSNLRLDAR